MQTIYLVNFFKWNTLYLDIPLDSSFSERSKDIRCLASKINCSMSLTVLRLIRKNVFSLFR
jgi:hypothetical protein